jgi:phage terminase large subunit-like protein
VYTSPTERSPEQKLAALPQAARDAWLADLDDWTLQQVQTGAWWWTRRPKQTRPEGDWFVWLIMSGRGWGKGRTGSEELVDMALANPRDRGGHPTPWLVVGETFADARDINMEGVSGIQPALTRRGYPYRERPPKGDVKCHTYNKTSPPTITIWPEGQKIVCQSADDEDVGRGYNYAGALLDELAKWGPVADMAWKAGIMPSLRADVPGWSPRVIVTTTPKPIKLLREWVSKFKTGRSNVVLTVGATYENVANLPTAYVQELLDEYEGSRLGRQELHGELLDEIEGALWTHDLIDKFRVKELPPDAELRRKVVGVDPTGTSTGDEMGVIVVAMTKDAHQYVIADHSKRISGMASARHAWNVLLEHDADCLVVEEDYAKDYLKDTLTVVYKEMQEEGKFRRYDRAPIEYVKARKYGGAKKVRALPVSMRYEVGRVHHVGVHAGLEDSQCTWDPNDTKADSPDRVDALVYACLWLRDQEGRRTAVSSAGNNLTLPVTRLTPLG